MPSFGDVVPINADGISPKDQGIRNMPDASEGTIEINDDVYGLPSTLNFDGLLRVPSKRKRWLDILGISQNPPRTSCIEAGLRACRAKFVAAWSISPSAKARIRKEDE